MGIAIGTMIVMDGWTSIIVILGQTAFFNNENGFFTDVSIQSGTSNQEDGDFSWGTCFFDHNNDGWARSFLGLWIYLTPTV